MAVNIYKVDSFADKPFSGNPAAVCILDKERSKEWMQGIAREMNLSETAFVLRKSNGRFSLRWFTPSVEVDLCGHATLASAHILYETNIVPSDQEIKFDTISGELIARKQSEWIELVFPNQMGKNKAMPKELAEAIGAKPKYVGFNELLYYLIELDSEKTVRNLKPNIELIRKISFKNGKRVIAGIIITSKSSSKNYDFVSRFFCPALGIDEDLVAGSTHCYLGPFWKERLNKNPLVGYQAFPGRGGMVRVNVDKDKVRISGKVITIIGGEVNVK